MSEQSTNFKPIEVKTNGLNLFGSDGNLLITSYLDNMINIQIAFPSEGEEGKKTYPKDNRVPIMLKKEAVQELSHVIMNDIIPAYAKGEENISYGIFLTYKKDSVLMIECKNDVFKLIYYWNINTERIPGGSAEFSFQKSPIIKQYDPSTGDFELEDIQSQFYCFAHMVVNFESIISTNAVSHGAKMGNAWTADQEMMHLKSIASKLGVSPIGASYREKENSENPFGMNKTSVNENSGYAAIPMTETTDIGDIFK